MLATSRPTTLALPATADRWAGSCSATPPRPTIRAVTDLPATTLPPRTKPGPVVGATRVRATTAPTTTPTTAAPAAAPRTPPVTVTGTAATPATTPPRTGRAGPRGATPVAETRIRLMAGPGQV